MTYYSREVIQKVKKIDLLTYLKNYEPDELVHFSKDTYTTRTHDSLKISNGMWYWFSQGKGGKSALDYLIIVRDYNFLQAVETILGSVSQAPPELYKSSKKLVLDRPNLPKKAPNNDKVKSYLISRGIDEDIIQECIDNDLIYQQFPNNNVVFVGYDSNKIARYAMFRGTNSSNFKGEVNGSHKAFSFQLEALESNDRVHLFESAIDLLSYATLMKLEGKEWYNESLLSLAGVYKPAENIEESKIPLALNYYLNQHPNVKKIYLHLDNDKAGRESTEAIKYLLKDRYEIIDDPPKIGKDINDFLCRKLKIRGGREYEKI